MRTLHARNHRRHVRYMVASLKKAHVPNRVGGPGWTRCACGHTRWMLIVSTPQLGIWTARHSQEVQTAFLRSPIRATWESPRASARVSLGIS